MAIQERWSSRELEAQFRRAAFERAVLSPPKVSPVVRQIHGDAASVFKDAYVVEFLNLPDDHGESDLHRALNVKKERRPPEATHKVFLLVRREVHHATIAPFLHIPTS